LSGAPSSFVQEEVEVEVEVEVTMGYTGERRPLQLPAAAHPCCPLATGTFRCCWQAVAPAPADVQLHAPTVPS
jgi:hypothetical protein